ncbi:MAG: 5'/3'-nucleotidase SurE [Cyanobacteria bacterium J06554_11]
MFVLTNDDGIDAPGIRALQRALEALEGKGQSAIVAPSTHLSGCSHQLNRGGTIPIDQRGENEYAIGGMPADCSRVAISHLYPDADWVLSGINAGGNLGADTYVSGTVAAVREATLMRKRAIAISQYRYRSEPYDWDRAARLTVQVLKRLMVEDINPGEFWNVNLPAPPPARTDGEAKHQTKDNPQIIFCGQCTQPLPTEFAIDETGFRYVGAYEERPRDVGADVDVCFGGNISVVKVRLW